MINYIHTCAAQLHALAPFAVVAIAMAFLKMITPKERDSYLAACLIGVSATSLLHYFFELTYGTPLTHLSFIKALPLALSIFFISVAGTIASFISVIIVFPSLRKTILKHILIAFCFSYLLVNASLAFIVPRMCHNDVYIQHKAEVIKPTH